MRPTYRRMIVAGALCCTVLAVPAQGQSTGLEDMVGARAGQAENALQARGYLYVRGEKGDDRSYAYWWNADRRQCVTIATMDGRYASITPSPAPDCGQSATADRNRPAIGARPQPYPPGAGDAPSFGNGPVELGLVCFGDGSRTGLTSGTRWTWNPKRDHYDYGSYSETRREVFDAALMVQLSGASGRIRLPKSLIPPINSRGNSGWWDLQDVRNGPDVITASYRLNGLNKPRVTIDRRSGRITVQGMADYGFRGSCDIAGTDDRRF